MITFDWSTIIIGLYDNLLKKSFYIIQFILFMGEDELTINTICWMW